jgi:hypothetical protein
MEDSIFSHNRFSMSFSQHAPNSSLLVGIQNGIKKVIAYSGGELEGMAFNRPHLGSALVPFNFCYQGERRSNEMSPELYKYTHYPQQSSLHADYLTA